MKTIIIYDTHGDSPIRFVVVDGDKSHLDGKYINCNASENEADEISEIIFYPTGHEKAWYERDGIFHDKFPYEHATGNYKVITFGFPP